MTARTIAALHPATRDDIGDLVTRRPLPGPGLEQIDPFLFLNHHGPQTYPPHNRGLPFGPHPHRGFETVTFTLAGELMHRDSGGHESVIRAGGVQWMTAARGLVHAELSPESFKRDGGPLEILQLWVNLPARLKMASPHYVGLQRADIPALSLEGGGTLDLIAGEWQGHAGPLETLADRFMSTVELPRGAALSAGGLARRNVLLYVARGAIRIGDRSAGAYVLVELGEAGDTLSAMAEEDSVLLFGHAPPIGEPVVSYGPFVMNTRDEIHQAMRDYQAGELGAPL